ncbi:hypothetical protein J1614_001375 [Plenodomus biglobosus]|nr:hypothetical protein J1614_001375 [Plenodomus biglobosus]
MSDFNPDSDSDSDLISRFKSQLDSDSHFHSSLLTPTQIFEFEILAPSRHQCGYLCSIVLLIPGQHRGSMNVANQSSDLDYKDATGQAWRGRDIFQTNTPCDWAILLHFTLPCLGPRFSSCRCCGLAIEALLS